MANITINQTPTRVQYTASNNQTVFSYTFPIKAASDLKVYKRANAAAPVDETDLLTITTDYTVTGANTAAGGTVVLVVPATTDDIVTIVGDKPVDRNAIYDQSVTVSKADLNNDFNDNVMYDKQIETIADQLTPKYARSELLGPDVREDNTILPILNDGYIWRGRGNFGDDPDDIEAVLLSSIVPSGGGGSTQLQVTQNGHGLILGDWVFLNGATYERALATSTVNAEVIGVVVEVIDVNTFVVQQSGHTSTLAGAAWGPFTAGDVLFLSDTVAGEASTTEPSDNGEVSKPVFVATSATGGWVFPYRGQIQGAAGGSGGGGNAPIDATYITQTPNGDLTNEQALSALATGLVKNTTGTGVLSIAANGTDYYGPGTPVPIPVDEGGTGNTTFTPYGVILGGTTATGPFQNVVGVGTAGQVLTSNGAGAAPTWQAGGSAGGGDWVSVETKDLTGVSEVEFLNLEADVCKYMIRICGAVASGGAISFRMLFSTDNGTTYETSNRYQAEISTNFTWISLGTNAILLLSDGVAGNHTSTTDRPDYGEVTIYEPNNAATRTMTTAEFKIPIRGLGASGLWIHSEGLYTIAEAHDAIKLLTDTNSFGAGCAQLFKYVCSP